MKKGSTIYWVLGFAGVGYLAYKFLKKPLASIPDSIVTPNTQTGGVQGGGTKNVAPISVIGKKAYAKLENAAIRSSAVVNNGAINNLWGLLQKDEEAGVITTSVVGQDGFDWYKVERSSNYNCSFLTCGATLPHKNGWIRSDVAYIK